MSPRTGRPKSDNPKDVRFSVRLDASTFARLKRRSEEDNITVAEAIRQAVELFLAKKK